MSAGNEGDPSPENFALITAQQAGAGSVVIAGAMDENRGLASFSNRAGSGEAWYLAALGSGVRTVDQNGVATAWSGTSFSAPIITGAVVANGDWSRAFLVSASITLAGALVVGLTSRYSTGATAVKA